MASGDKLRSDGRQQPPANWGLPPSPLAIDEEQFSFSVMKATATDQKVRLSLEWGDACFPLLMCPVRVTLNKFLPLHGPPCLHL